MNREKLIDILSKVYPALYQYLLPYRFGNALLDQYFQDYKYQKIINKILLYIRKGIFDYQVFLDTRRTMMAQYIREYYESLA